jgi:exosortase/archaeosortase family protein
MKKDSKEVSGLIIRYGLILLTAISSFWIFYFIFTPLTVYPVYFILNLFFDSSLIGTTIMMKSFSIELINSCIAGSAYFLLWALNLSVPNIKTKKRLLMLGFAFLSFLIINILRIFILSLIFISGSSWFDITHKLFWYLLSFVFVIGIWFIEIKFFKIKEIPFYSDLKSLYKKSLLRK